MLETQMTIRLPSPLLRKVRERARHLGLKRSDLVRMAIAGFLEDPEDLGPSLYERTKHLVGSLHTGITDLGEKHREYLIKRLRRRVRPSP